MKDVELQRPAYKALTEQNVVKVPSCYIKKDGGADEKVETN